MPDFLTTGLFSSTDGQFTLAGFLICLMSALALGALIAVVHKKTTPTNGSFTVTLAIIPAVVTVIIMMVNGSIGAGIAVAGAFSLVRFRSAPGTAKEIGSIFLAMATGLSCGMGYPLFGLIFSVILCIMLVIYDAVRFGQNSDELMRNLVITMPEDLNYTNAFDSIFETYTSEHKLERIKTSSLGSLNRLTYTVKLKTGNLEKEMIDAIRCRNGNLEIVLSGILDPSTEM